MSDERLAEINKRAGWVMRKLNLDVAGFPLSSGESVAKRVLREDIPWLLARVRELEAQTERDKAIVDAARDLRRAEAAIAAYHGPSEKIIDSLVDATDDAAARLDTALAENVRIAALEAQVTRPEIALFARLMEARMARHDSDWGDTWRQTPVSDVLGQIEYAINELKIARWGNSTSRMAEKAADVANFALMAAFAMSAGGAVVAALADTEGEG